MLPSAYGLGQYFQGLGHSFSPYGLPSRQITYIYFPLPVIYSVRSYALFRVSSSWRNFISYEIFLWPFSLFFLLKLMIFRQMLVLLVRNDRNWSSLLRCITLNVRVCSLTPPISLTCTKGLQKTSSEEWSMILHTTNDSFVILKHNDWKETARSLTLIMFLSFKGL